jgi:hypothetical protein
MVQMDQMDQTLLNASNDDGEGGGQRTSERAESERIKEDRKTTSGAESTGDSLCERVRSVESDASRDSVTHCNFDNYELTKEEKKERERAKVRGRGWR